MFTTLGYVASFFALGIGVAAIVGAFIVAPDMFAPDFDRMDMRQSTLWMRQGATLIFLGLVLGELCEISEKVEK